MFLLGNETDSVYTSYTQTKRKKQDIERWFAVRSEGKLI